MRTRPDADPNRLIGLFYEAVAAPALWKTALGEFAKSVQAIDAHIIALDKETGRPVFAETGNAGLARQFLPSYLQQWAPKDPLIPLMLAKPRGAGELMLCNEYISTRQVRKSEFFQDFVIPQGLRYQAAWVLKDNDEVHAVLDLHRRNSPFERELLGRWNGVAQHLARAVRLGIRLAEFETRKAWDRQAVDQAHLQYLIVDGTARLLEQSAGAAAVLRRAGPVYLNNRGRLETSTLEDTRRLLRLITSAVKGCGGGEMVVGSSSPFPLRIQIVPAGISSDSPFTPMHSNCALIVLKTRMQRTEPEASAIREYLQCTRAEAQVAAELVKGRSPGQIAASRHVTINTVRTQVRELLDCSKTRRISELVSCIARL